MGEQEDVNKPGASSASDSNSDDGHQPAGSGSDIPDGDKSGEQKTIPYARFKEIVDKANGLEKVVNFFRQHIESPDDLVAFAEYKKTLIDKAEKEEAKGDISPAQLARFKKAMDLANPQLAALVKRMEQQEEVRMEAQFDSAEEQIRELCQSSSLATEGKSFARIAVHVMDEIRSDESLLRMWHAGNMKCVDKAFKLYKEEFLDSFKKDGGDKKAKDMLAEKRRIMRMPALPSGRSGGPSGAPERKQEEKGITKKTHEDAWEVFQSHMQE